MLGIIRPERAEEGSIGENISGVKIKFIFGNKWKFFVRGEKCTLLAGCWAEGAK